MLMEQGIVLVAGAGDNGINKKRRLINKVYGRWLK